MSDQEIQIGPPRREQQACSVLPDPEDTEAYSKWIDELTGQCTCEGMDKPCDRLLVGGHCDDMHLCSDDFANDGDDYSPVEPCHDEDGCPIY